jgi:hypothetical protein
VPTHTRSRPDLRGYYRINQERLLRACRRKDIPNVYQLAKDLSGVIAESTLWRVYHDQNAPTARIMYALTTILDVKVEDIFDPVVLADGEEPPSTHKRSL